MDKKFIRDVLKYYIVGTFAIYIISKLIIYLLGG